MRLAHPKIYPTIDITAAVLPYANRLDNHAVGSGKVVRNHSWNTGGKLAWCFSHFSGTLARPLTKGVSVVQIPS